MSKADQAKDAVLPEGAKQVPPKKKSNKTLFIVLGVILMLMALPGLLIFGFVSWISHGDNAVNLVESAIEKSIDGDVDIDTKDGTFTVESEEGSLSYSGSIGLELSDDFPSEVILHENQAITTSVSASEGEASGWSVSAVSEDSLSAISEFIESEYDKQGWTQVSAVSRQEASNYSYTNDSTVVHIAIGSQEGKSVINYIVARKK